MDRNTQLSKVFIRQTARLGPPAHRTHRIMKQKTSALTLLAVGALALTGCSTTTTYSTKADYDTAFDSVAKALPPAGYKTPTLDKANGKMTGSASMSVGYSTALEVTVSKTTPVTITTVTKPQGMGYLDWAGSAQDYMDKELFKTMRVELRDVEIKAK